MLFLAALTASCGLFKRFDPNAPLAAKWAFISDWTEGGARYYFIIDVNKLAAAPFYKEAFEKSPGRYFSLFSKIDADTEAGIVVVTDKFVYIGGRFDKATIASRIEQAFEKEKGLLEESTYKKKRIYTDKSGTGGESFALLEKYLLVFGSKTDIKALIDAREKKAIIPPAMNTDHLVWGRIKDASNLYPKLTSVTISADLQEILNIRASTDFATETEAANFAEQMTGIKTIKTIESVDEPWLADSIDGIKIERNLTNVVLSSAIDAPTAKRLIKRWFK
jgi:hypothetical protein